MNAALQLQRRDDLRDESFVAVLADAHLDLVGEVDAFDLFEKAVHEMLPRLLALGDDVDARIFLHLDRKQRRVALGVDEFAAFKLPRRPKLVRLGQPFGFRQ